MLCGSKWTSLRLYSQRCIENSSREWKAYQNQAYDRAQKELDSNPNLSAREEYVLRERIQRIEEQRNPTKKPPDAAKRGPIREVDNGLIVNGHVIPQPDNPDLRVLPYGRLMSDASIPGQANHVNQNAAYRSVINQNAALSAKLRGNIFEDAGAPHTVFHVEIEKFWAPYRAAGTKPTNHEYNIAAYNALKAAGLSGTEAQQVMRFTIAQQIEYHLFPDTSVPVVPQPIRNLARN